jgi:ribosomal protein L37AE/L43A
MDVFGNSDPKKMPLHLFHGAISIDYSTAVRAEVTKITLFAPAIGILMPLSNASTAARISCSLRTSSASGTSSAGSSWIPYLRGAQPAGRRNEPGNLQRRSLNRNEQDAQQAGSTGRGVRVQVAIRVPLAPRQWAAAWDHLAMPTCPICQKPLETTRQREGVFYPCQVCSGRAVTLSQIRYVLGDRLATKLLRLMKLSRRQSERRCPFCDKSMLVLNTQEPPLELDACRACNSVWFDGPTYEALPQLSFETTNSIALQATEIIAMERLTELKEREEE